MWSLFPQCVEPVSAMCGACFRNANSMIERRDVEMLNHTHRFFKVHSLIYTQTQTQRERGRARERERDRQTDRPIN